MTDMAGRESGAANYGDTVAGKEFTVDKTIAKRKNRSFNKVFVLYSFSIGYIF